MLGGEEEEDAVEHCLVLRVVYFEREGGKEGRKDLVQRNACRVGRDQPGNSAAHVVDRVNVDIVHKQGMELLEHLGIIPTEAAEGEIE